MTTSPGLFPITLSCSHSVLNLAKLVFLLFLKHTNKASASNPLNFPLSGIFYTMIFLYLIPHFVYIDPCSFSSVQPLSHVLLFVTPWTAARQASLSVTNSRSSFRLTSIESVMSSSHLILCRPLLLLPPSIRVFSNESTLRMRWPKYWSFCFSIIPSKDIPGLISFRMDWGHEENRLELTRSKVAKDSTSSGI